MSDTLSTGEFTRSMDRLHTTIKGRFDQVERRVDDCVSEIASVRATLDERTSKEKKSTRNSASGWSAVVAAVIVGALELVKAWVK